MLELVELESQARKRPAQLSGGQQQRVALARALINKPEVLLLDEPLGALDLKLRRAMQIELKRIQVDVGLTFIHVTHDQEEAMTMADTVAVMNKGIIEQMGAPGELYENPRSTFVANFLGQSNLIEGDDQEPRRRPGPVDMHGIDVSVPRRAVATPTSDRGWVGIRPEKVLIGEEGEELDAPGNTIPGGVVTDASFVGVSTQYLVRMPWGQELQIFEQNTGRRRLFHVGERGGALLAPGVRVPARHLPGRPRGPGRGRQLSTETTRRHGKVGYLLLAPAFLWLVLFFVIPFYSLLATSLYDPSGSDFRGYEMTYAWGNYVDALQAYWQPAVRSLVVRRPRDGVLPGARLRAGVRDRLQGRPVEEPACWCW